MSHPRTFLSATILIGVALGIAGCGDDTGGKKGTTDPRLTLETLQTVNAGADNNPEIIRMIPGTTDEAIFVASAVNKLGTVTYGDSGLTIDQLTAVPESTYDPGRLYSELSSIAVDPAGQYVAVLRLDTRCPTTASPSADYVPGSIMFVDIAPPHAVIADVQVGFAPDSVAISNDGNWAVVANEADPERSGEDANACLAPNQGSVSIIDLSAGVANATMVQNITALTPDLQLPEGVKISPDNDTVIVALQISDQFGLLKLSEAPSATMSLFALPEGAGPDGMYITKDGGTALVSNEYGDSFSLVSLPGGAITTTYSIRDAADVPERYNRDAQKTTRLHEPEECVVMDMGEQRFALFALQESHAVIAYDITDAANVAFADITEVGLGWEAEANGRGKSEVGSEGIDARDGFILVANEREGSISLVKATVE